MGIFGYTGPDILPRWVDFTIANAAALAVLGWYWKNSSISAGQMLVAAPLLLVIVNGLAAFLSRHKSKKLEEQDNSQGDRS